MVSQCIKMKCQKSAPQVEQHGDPAMESPLFERSWAIWWFPKSMCWEDFWTFIIPGQVGGACRLRNHSNPAAAQAWKAFPEHLYCFCFSETDSCSVTLCYTYSRFNLRWSGSVGSEVVCNVKQSEPWLSVPELQQFCLRLQHSALLHHHPCLPGALGLFGLGRDSLDWHRLVLGGQRRVKIKDPGQFYSDEGGGIDIRAPWQQFRRECSAPLTQQQMGGEMPFEQSLVRRVLFFSLRCELVWMPWFLFQEKIALKCPIGPKRDCKLCT